MEDGSADLWATVQVTHQLTRHQYNVRIFPPGSFCTKKRFLRASVPVLAMLATMADHKCRLALTCPVQIKGGIENKHGKANILLQVSAQSGLSRTITIPPRPLAEVQSGAAREPRLSAAITRSAHAVQRHTPCLLLPCHTKSRMRKSVGTVMLHAPLPP